MEDNHWAIQKVRMLNGFLLYLSLRWQELYLEHAH